jgi:hypothetical protein
VAHLTIRVPEPHVAELRRALLTAHTRCTEALVAEAARYRAAPGDLDALEGALVEVRDLHEALDQLGWTSPARERSVRLTADPAVFEEALTTLRRPGWFVLRLDAAAER